MLHPWEPQDYGVLSSCWDEKQDELMVQGADLKEKRFGSWGDHASSSEPPIDGFDQERMLKWFYGLLELEHCVSSCY